jgi:hypothetical protein
MPNKHGGKRKGTGRKPAPVGTIIMDCVPMMADIVSGAVPRPVEIAIGAHPTRWLKRTLAWQRIVKQVRASRINILARRGQEPSPEHAVRVANMRDILGEVDAVVFLFGGGVYVAINIDGTRAAMSDKPADLDWKQNQ